jgi:hypothetical protein
MCIFWIVDLEIRNCLIVQISVGQLGIRLDPAGVNLSGHCAALARVTVPPGASPLFRTMGVCRAARAD